MRSLFEAPQDEERCRVCNHVCQRQFKKRDLVCADHFLPTDYILGQKRATLLPKAVPISPPSSFIQPPNSFSIQDPSSSFIPPPSSSFKYINLPTG